MCYINAVETYLNIKNLYIVLKLFVIKNIIIIKKIHTGFN